MTTLILSTVLFFVVCAFGLAAYDAYFWRKAAARWRMLALEALELNQELLQHKKGSSHVKER